VEAQGAGPDQGPVGPGEGLLEDLSVGRSADLGGAAGRWSQASVEADGQDEPDKDGRAIGVEVAQVAARACRAVSGTICGLGTSA
jgi:hypothetical protein